VDAARRRRRVTGEEELRSDRPCVYMVNHQSSLDMLCAGGWVPRRTVVIAKRSLRLVPFMGQFLTLADTIFLNRRNHESAMYSMERAGERLSKRRLSVIIFPEGTRSRSDGELLPFKKGGFNLAVAAQVPIVPVVMAQQKPIYDPARHRFLPGTIAVKGPADRGCDAFARACARVCVAADPLICSRRLVWVPCAVLPPVPTTGLTREDVPELADRVRDMMAAELRSLVAVPSGKF